MGKILEKRVACLIKNMIFGNMIHCETMFEYVYTITNSYSPSTIISKSQRCLYKKLFYLKHNYFFLSNQQFPNILISGAHNRLELFYAQGDVKLY